MNLGHVQAEHAAKKRETVSQYTADLIGAWKRAGAADSPETLRVATKAILGEIKARIGGRVSRSWVRNALYTA
jgi:hypothetical protein